MEVLSFIKIIFMLISLTLFIITIALCINSYIKKKNHKETYGIIIDIKKQSKPGELNYVLIPTIQYNVNGKEYIRIGGAFNPKMKVGDKIKVLYSIKDPNKCVSYFGIYLPPIILAITTIITLCITIILSVLN